MEEDDDDDDEDEMRDDHETIPLSQFGCFTPTSHQDEAVFFSSESETSPDNIAMKDMSHPAKPRSSKVSEKNNDTKNTIETDSPEMMEILDAMRQIIFKQQDAIQAISDENIEFRNQLAACHRDMKTMQTESADQLIQITQLVIQKNSLDSETTQLKDEVAKLRDEILRLKSDDADLVNRFESLMNNHDDMTDDEDTIVDKIDVTTPLHNHSNNELWRQMLEPIDQRSTPNQVMSHNTNASRIADTNAYPQTSITTDTIDAAIVDVVNTSSSSNSANVTVETILSIPPTTGTPQTTKKSLTPDHLATKKDNDVAEFKNRLGEIQKKRMMRTGPSGRNHINHNHRDDTTADVTNTKDRKVLTVRFL